MLQVYALCGGYLELDVALMLPDHDPGSRWTVPVPAFFGHDPAQWQELPRAPAPLAVG